MSTIRISSSKSPKRKPYGSSAKTSSSKKTKYTNSEYYEDKLRRVMQRFGVDEKDYNWNYDRNTGGWVEFKYKDQLYRFEHTIENAKAHGQDINYGSDAFAQIVLALEDLARLVDRGIYDLQTWVRGMKALPQKTEAEASVPSFFRFLGFDRIPSSKEEVEKQFHKVAPAFHPDSGGSDESFTQLMQAKEQAMKYFK